MVLADYRFINIPKCSGQDWLNSITSPEPSFPKYLACNWLMASCNQLVVDQPVYASFFFFFVALLSVAAECEIVLRAILQCDTLAQSNLPTVWS